MIRGHDAARVLYTGPALAGVGTSVRHLAEVCRIKLEGYPRYRFEHVTEQGIYLVLQTDPRIPSYFEDSFDTRKRNPSMRPYFTEHIEFLQQVDVVVFVADSQIEKREANEEALDRLRAGLKSIGRNENIPLVLQANKRDLPNAAPLADVESWVRWPHAELVPSIALTGDGVATAIRLALSLVAPASIPYR